MAHERYATMTNDKTNPVFRVDYLSVTVHDGVEDESIDDVLQVLGLFDTVHIVGRGGRSYRNRLALLAGGSVYFDPTDDGTHYHVELKGETCSHVGLDSIMSMFEWLNASARRWNVTRIDLALDHQLFTVPDFWFALENEDCETRVERRNMKRFYDLDGDGDTVYVGSKQSEKLLRVYKKSGSDEFDGDYTRVELQLRDKPAAAAVNMLLHVSTYAHWLMQSVALVRGFIDINAGWWVDFCGKAAQAKISISRPVPSVDSVEVWLRGQVAPSLATVLRHHRKLNRDAVKWLSSLIDEGTERMQPRHHQMVQLGYRVDKELELEMARGRFAHHDIMKARQAAKQLRADRLENDLGDWLAEYGNSSDGFKVQSWDAMGDMPL